MSHSEKLKQNSFTGTIRPEVRIISSTENPIGTIFSLWYGSRHKDTVDPGVIQDLYFDKKLYTDEERDITKSKILEAYPEHSGDDGTDYKNVISSIVKLVLEADLPPSESVLFNVEVNNANVAWREQLVRSKFASYWTQTSRTQDMTSMDVNMNDSIKLLGGEEAVKIYEDTVEQIREAYRVLSELGVPMEDVRLQPQGHVHRVYWMINLRSLLKVLNKRADWIAQASLWTPIMAGVYKELRRIGIFDLVEGMLGKPLSEVTYSEEDNKYKVTKHYQTKENEDRFYGRDPLPCDPLWLAYTGNPMPESTNIEFYDYLKSMFIHLWSDDYLSAIGWDRENPDRLGPYDRPNNTTV